MNKYKAVGSLVGFESTLFNEVEKLINKWVVNGITVTFDNGIIKMHFVYDDCKYELTGRQLKNVYYAGIIKADGEDCGKFYIWVYTNEKGCILMGQWVEDGTDYELWGLFAWKK